MSNETRSAKPSLPGELGLWIFIFCDLLLFTLFFGLVAFDLRSEPETFRQGKAAINLTIGMVNTLVLLTGSWAVAMGTRVVEEPRRAARYIYAAALSGIVFLLFKVVEYSHLLGEGHALTQDRYFTWYFFLTAFHALHVIAAIVLLWVVAGRFRRNERTSHELVEAAGCYWHLVDLLWIGIFLVLYLI